MQLLMVAMEWVALLLGLLPLGGRVGHWSPKRTVLAVVIAGLTLLMDVTFFIVSALCLREIETSRLDMIVGIVIVEYALAKSVVVLAVAPLRIISEADLNFAGQVICPEVGIEVARLLKMCEKPLVIRPCGMYTISRSNMLAMLSAISTYLVVLLQFQSPNDISFPYPQQGNDSVSL
ncbi:hypothetical protein E2C01_011609 [Portunus trituberculatus]|uniref:Uncharacterized protein n=1 Tax=Portunus trituberculatus TaxID=210409 RepID=A0A5B7DBI2_PORTR|nr:hypothetical protein [Portunus trituberculatus]